MEKAFQRIYWENKPSTETPVDANNLNRIEAGVDTIDDRVVTLDTSQSGLTTRVTTAESNITALQNGKVDKVSGKDLSTNDYTTEDKNKLAGISAQANRTTVTQVQESGDTSKEIAQIGLDGETTSIYADDAKKVIESCYEEKTVTGNPITIKTISGSNAKALKVTMNPIQDLHGYSNPWAGGAGKNKAKVTLSSGTYYNVQFIVDAFGRITINGVPSSAVAFPVAEVNLVGGTSYILSGGVDGDYRLYIQVDGTPYTSGSTESSVFTPTTSGKYDINIVVTTGASVGDTVSPMIRLATETDATYAPYSNICPIIGRTEASVNQGSVDITTLYNGQIQSTGAYTGDTKRICNVNNAQMNTYFLKKGTHTLTFNKLNQSAPDLVQCTVLTKNDNFEIVDNFATSWHSLPYTFELTVDAYVYFTARKDYETELNTADYKTLIIDETHTHQYSETIYGGVDDFVNGGLSNEWGYIKLSNMPSNRWNKLSASNTYYMSKSYSLPLAKAVVAGGIYPISDKYIYQMSGTMENNSMRLSDALYIRDDRFTTLADWLSYVSNTDAEICYELATPTTISTSAEEITLLKGNNVLSTNADDMELSYQELPDITSLAKYIQTLEARIKTLEEG